MKRSILRAGVVLAIGTAVLPGLSGVARGGDVADRWYGDPPTSWDAADHPDCGAALAKVYVAGAAGAVGGPAGLVAGAAGALPDVYLDCPPIRPHQQNGT